MSRNTNTPRTINLGLIRLRYYRGMISLGIGTQPRTIDQDLNDINQFVTQLENGKAESLNVSPTLKTQR